MILLLILLGCLLAPPGCTPAGPKGAPDPGGINPCSLITQAEASAVLGVPVGQTEPQEWAGGAVECRYIAPADQNLTIQVYPGGARAYESYVRAFEKAQRARPHKLGGLGDQAVFQAGQVVVLRREHFFVISIGLPMEDTDRLRMSKTLARKVLSRL